LDPGVNGWVPYALLAALNPTLLGATTVMLLLDNPRRLLFGYLLGALMTSVTLGLVIVLALDGSAKTAQHTLSPTLDLALGGILLVVSYAIRPSDRPEASERRLRKQQAKEAKGPPLWQRTLNRGSAWTTFVVGALLTLPGASYLIGLHRIADQDAGTGATVAMVVAFNAIMLAILELPLLGFLVAPDWTRDVVERFRLWFTQNARRLAAQVALIIGALLIVRGLVYLL
jgi:Sap, sulfolipid-1-addressing protein